MNALLLLFVSAEWQAWGLGFWCDHPPWVGPSVGPDGNVWGRQVEVAVGSALAGMGMIRVLGV